jgi:hypothetical protein
MGFWSNLFGGIEGASFPTGMYQSMPPPPPPSVHTPLAQLNSTLYANAQLSAQSRTGGLMGTHMSGTPEMYRIDQNLYKLQQYAEMCGDTIETVELAEGEQTDDVKVAILKATEAGTVLKNVGMKLSDNRFAVYREQGE